MKYETAEDREKRINPLRHVAVVGIFNKEKKILLVRTKRLPDKWQPIGGGIKAIDASPIDTIIREVKEEINLELNKEKIIHEIDCKYDFGEGIIYFFSAYINCTASLKYDPEEIEELRWFLLYEVREINVFPATRTYLNHILSKTHE